MSYKRAPKKAELYEQIERLEEQNRKLSDELERDRRRQWELRIPEAACVMCRFLEDKFPGTWRNVRFEHVDAAGYWYTFELKMDSRRQTWCVRHSDLEEK